MVMEADTDAKPTTLRVSTYETYFSTIPLDQPVNRILNFDGSHVGCCMGAICTPIIYDGRKHNRIIHIAWITPTPRSWVGTSSIL